MPSPSGGVVMTAVVIAGASCTAPVARTAAECSLSTRRHATLRSTHAKSGKPLNGATKPPTKRNK